MIVARLFERTLFETVVRAFVEGLTAVTDPAGLTAVEETFACMTYLTVVLVTLDIVRVPSRTGSSTSTVTMFPACKLCPAFTVRIASLLSNRLFVTVAEEFEKTIDPTDAVVVTFG